jgi:hypothetical protein
VHGAGWGLRLLRLMEAGPKQESGLLQMVNCGVRREGAHRRVVDEWWTSGGRVEPHHLAR